MMFLRHQRQQTDGIADFPAAANRVKPDRVQNEIDQPPNDEQHGDDIGRGRPVVHMADDDSAEHLVPDERETDRQDRKNLKNVLSDVF